MGLGPTDPTEQYFDKGLWGYDGTQWRKLGLLWGYTDRWIEQTVIASAAAGWNFLETVAVPAGYVYVGCSCAAVNATTNPSTIQIGINVGGARWYTKNVLSPGVNVYVDWTSQMILKEGDKVVAAIGGCVAGDVLVFNVWGYKMAVT